jgi:hypothetical protein
MSFAIVRDCRKNFITDAIVDHGMSCLHTKIVGMLHDGIDLLIIDRPNKVDSRREGFKGDRENAVRKLTAIVSRILVVELLKMGCCFMCASTIAKKILDEFNVLKTCLERSRSRLVIIVVGVGLGRSLGTSVMVAGRSRVAIVVLVAIALVVVVAMVIVTSPSTAETSPSSAKTATSGLISLLKPWITSIMLTTIVLSVVVVVSRRG